MRRTILLILYFVLVQSAFAQIKIGLRGGTLLANFDYKVESESINTQNILSYQAGVQINAKIGTVFGFNTGVLYTAKGSELDVIKEEGKMNINYLDIPLMLEARLSPSKINIFIEGGINLSVALNGTFDDGVNSPEDIKFGQKNDEISFTDYSASFGGGVNLSQLRLGFNYNMGLKDISNSSIEEIKNSNMLIYAVLFF